MGQAVDELSPSSAATLSLSHFNANPHLSKADIVFTENGISLDPTLSFYLQGRFMSTWQTTRGPWAVMNMGNQSGEIRYI